MINDFKQSFNRSQQAFNDTKAYNHSNISVSFSLSFNNHPCEGNNGDENGCEDQGTELPCEDPFVSCGDAISVYIIVPVTANNCNSKSHDIVAKEHKEKPHEAVKDNESNLFSPIVSYLLLVIQVCNSDTHANGPIESNNKGKNDVNEGS